MSNEIEFWKDSIGRSYSSYPSTTHLTFDYHIYMVPQYRPESILMLGYAGGKIAGLVRLLYGDVPITGVDIDPCEDRYGVEFIQADAKEFVKTCKKYDSVLVDLFSKEYCDSPCDFVSSPEFVNDLKRIGNYIIVNGLHSDMSAYEKEFKRIGINKPSGSAEQIYYYTNDCTIPNLHPWKS
jgi:hypothetical protein